MSHPDTREWLLANGLGGYTSTTVCGANTRRYHGLLVAAVCPPVKRRVLLARVDEFVHTSRATHELSCSCWQDSTTIRGGYSYLSAFTLDPVPTWTYRVAGGELSKQVFCPPGHNSVVIAYHWRGDNTISLEIKLLANDRDYHSQTVASPDWQFHQQVDDRGVFRVQAHPPGEPVGTPWYWRCTPYRYTDYRFGGQWYHDYHWPAERERGLPDHEDNYYLGSVLGSLMAGDRIALTCTTEADPRALDMRDLVSRRKDDAHRAVNRARLPQVELSHRLVDAADQFVVRRGATGEASIMAGYHWFTDWGRDAMLSLPGLLLCTGRVTEARGVLHTFAAQLDRGMLPNCFGDYGDVEYNTIDATLLWFDALYNYWLTTEDHEFIHKQYPRLIEALEAHLASTRYGIAVDARDGLLAGGVPGVALTWMDARVDGEAITPRHGKPVEVNALWYNALRIMEKFAELEGDSGGRWRELAERTASGMQAFWYAGGGYLYDVLGDVPDASLRPNQLLAFSLPHRVFTPDQARQVLTRLEACLLTPYGLRTLDPADPRYCSTYTGDPRQRDRAYHQGTVWPWLLGPFCTAYLNTHGRTRTSFEQVRQWLLPIIGYLKAHGTIAEVFDADPPHRAGGCMAQAWSVAQVLALYAELTEAGLIDPT